MTIVALAHPVFAFLGVLAILMGIFGFMMKTIKTTVFFVVLALVCWAVFFAG
jgi:hypothetical protein